MNAPQWSNPKGYVVLVHDGIGVIMLMVEAHDKENRKNIALRQGRFAAFYLFVSIESLSSALHMLSFTLQSRS